MLGLFQDVSSTGDVQHSESYVPISRMCEKQIAVSHRSAEAEATSPEAGLKMECMSALTWNVLASCFIHSALATAKHSHDMPSNH